MEPVFSNEQMRKIDERSINEYGLKGIVLMENAARFSYEQIKNIVKNNAIVVCGSGNNSGDGYALSRQLFTRGVNVEIYRKKAPKTKDARINYNICRKIGIPMFSYEKLLDKNVRDTLIVDAIFGIGLNKEIKGIYRDIIGWINEQKQDNFIFSMDIPSGLEANTGKILGVCVDSHMIATFGGYKRGFFQTDGAKFYKRVVYDNISTPANLLNSNIRTFDLPVLRKLELGFNKYDLGKVGIISGSIKYSGAPVISSLGLLKSGAGMLYLITPSNIDVKGIPSEIISVKFPQNAGYFSADIDSEQIEFLQTLDLIILGPGIGRSKELNRFLEKILKNYSGKVVVDADAIVPVFNFLKKNTPKFEYIFTPHLGELNKMVPSDKYDIFEIIEQLSSSLPIPILVKGQFAYFSDGMGNVYIQPHASAYMSKGGTGDGLAGLLGGLWASGYSLHDAVNLATFLIGRTAEILEEKNYISNIHITKILDNLDLGIKEL